MRFGLPSEPPDVPNSFTLYVTRFSLFGNQIGKKSEMNVNSPRTSRQLRAIFSFVCCVAAEELTELQLVALITEKSQQNENENFLLAHTGGSKWPAQRAVKVTSRSVISHASSHLETAKKRDKISNVFQGETKETLKLAIGRGK